MKNLFFLFIILVFFACHTSAPMIEKEENECLLLFTENNHFGDTIHFTHILDDLENSIGDSLIQMNYSNSILMQHGLHNETTLLQPLDRFPIGEKHEACLLNTNEFWFKNQFLLFFDLEQNQFNSFIFPIVSFNGGDGGQIASESWLYTVGENTFIYQKDSSRSLLLRTSDGEPKVIIDERSTLYQWNNGTFDPIPQTDSLGMSAHFQMKWNWDEF